MEQILYNCVNHGNCKHLNVLIKNKVDLNAPKAKMVIATLGQTKKDAKGTHGQIINAMFNVAGESGKYPENKNKVATVYSNPLSKGGSSSGHYSGNGETYMNVGQAMGQAMVKMLKKDIHFMVIIIKKLN